MKRTQKPAIINAAFMEDTPPSTNANDTSKMLTFKQVEDNVRPDVMDAYKPISKSIQHPSFTKMSKSYKAAILSRESTSQKQRKSTTSKPRRTIIIPSQSQPAEVIMPKRKRLRKISSPGLGNKGKTANSSAEVRKENDLKTGVHISIPSPSELPWSFKPFGSKKRFEILKKQRGISQSCRALGADDLYYIKMSDGVGQTKEDQQLKKVITATENRYTKKIMKHNKVRADGIFHSSTDKCLCTETPEHESKGIQTGKLHLENVSDSKEDLLELLRELVVTPHKHLNSVLKLIGNELSKPRFSYQKMLRYVHEFTDFDDIDTGIPDNEKQQKRIKMIHDAIMREEERAHLGRQLHKIAGFLPSSKLPGSPHAISTLAKHVIDDYAFERNITNTASLFGAGPNKKQELNYTIEDGAHGLHKTLSEPPTPECEVERCEKKFRSSPELRNRDMVSGHSSIRRTPSKATCHFSKVSGEVYHMYLRKDGTTFFSILSPQEKGMISRNTYLGSYRQNENKEMTLVSSPSSFYKSIQDNKVDLSMLDSASSMGETTCGVRRIPGCNYYKYRRNNGSSFLTTISPKIWGSSCPHTFVRAYRETIDGVLIPTKTSSTALLHSPKRDRNYLSTALDSHRPSSSPALSANLSNDDSAEEYRRRRSFPSFSMRVTTDQLPAARILLESQSSSRGHSMSPDILNSEHRSPPSPAHKSSLFPSKSAPNRRVTPTPDSTVRTTLSSVECLFSRMPGNTYHLYKRRDGSTFTSTLPPTEVDESISATFLASYVQKENGEKMILCSSETETPSSSKLSKSESARPATVPPSTFNSHKSTGRELVEVLLKKSDEEFLENQRSSNWVQEFLTEMSSARKHGLPTHTSDNVLYNGLRKLRSSSAQPSMNPGNSSSSINSGKEDQRSSKSLPSSTRRKRLYSRGKSANTIL